MGFSPEGDRVLFSTIESDSLWSIGVEGSEARLVVAGTWEGEWLEPSVVSDDVAADPPVELQPARSGTLAYVLDGDVYVADSDGSNAVKIADGLPPEDCREGDLGEYWAEGPMWSPDGRYLAYRHDTDCSDLASWPDVEISDAEGNVLATFPAQGWGVAWSPDSTRVAVWDRLYDPPVIDPFNDPPATIGVYGLDGSRQTQLAMPSEWTSGDNGDGDPAWMPDGTSLRVHNLEMPLDGSTPRKLLPPLPALRYSMISYSPDGSRVAYVDRDMSLVVAAADGSDPRQVEERWVLDPVWSPTGDRIAFIYSEEKDVYRSNELRVLDVATGEVTPLVGTGRSQDIWNIQFSPEGDRIVFVGWHPAGEPWGLWSVGVDGSDARLVIAGTAQGAWSR
jgi:Tol biopolymer transport system component